MKLLTKEIKEALPKLYSTEGNPDPMVVCKFFDPTGRYTWFVTEFDGEDTFFGLVDGDFREWGYFTLSELQAVRGRFGLGIERDMYFSPRPVSQLGLD